MWLINHDKGILFKLKLHRIFKALLSKDIPAVIKQILHISSAEKSSKILDSQKNWGRLLEINDVVSKNITNTLSFLLEKCVRESFGFSH